MTPEDTATQEEREIYARYCEAYDASHADMPREPTAEEITAGRWTRARLAAHRKAQDGDDLDELTRQCFEAQTENDIADTAAMVAHVATAPKMTLGQMINLRRLWNAPRPPAPPTQEELDKAQRDSLRARLDKAEQEKRKLQGRTKRLRAELAALEEEGQP